MIWDDPRKKLLDGKSSPKPEKNQATIQSLLTLLGDILGVFFLMNADFWFLMVVTKSHGLPWSHILAAKKEMRPPRGFAYAHSLYYAEPHQSLACATPLQGAPFWETLTQSFERGSHDFKISIHIYYIYILYIYIYVYEYLNSIMQSSWTDLDRLLF